MQDRGRHRVRVYGLSHAAPARAARVTGRFAAVGYDVHWVESVSLTDARLASVENMHTRCVHSCMHGHLNMLRAFLDSEDGDGAPTYGVFCEDDIYIRRDFSTSIQIAVDAYERMRADVLLLGYLLQAKAAATRVCPGHELMEPAFVFLAVQKEIWGSQMYMYSKPAAARALAAFCNPLAIVGPFSADWTLTKFGVAVMMYPMLAVEEGNTNADNVLQAQFHKQCFLENFNPDDYI